MAVNSVGNNPGNVPAPGAKSSGVDKAKAGKLANRQAVEGYGKANQGEYVKEAANVSISPKAKEMSLARKVAESAPDVREDKVAELKAKIARGDYRPDANKIADGLMRETLRDELSKDPELLLKG